METFLANLKHAIRNHENVKIGGGIFTSTELKQVLVEIESLQGDRAKLNEILPTHDAHPNPSGLDREAGPSPR